MMFVVPPQIRQASVSRKKHVAVDEDANGGNEEICSGDCDNKTIVMSRA